MTAFHSVGQLVSWRLERCFFVGRVVNTALSGIEAFCPSKAQYQSLTSLVTCLARRVMAGAAARRGEHGRVRTNVQQGGAAFLGIGTMRCGSPGAKTQMGTDFGAGPCAPHTTDHCYVWEAAVRA